MLAFLVAVPTVIQNSLHPVLTLSIVAHLQGKITGAGAPTSGLDATPSGLSMPPPPTSLIGLVNSVINSLNNPQTSTSTTTTTPV